MDDAQGNLLTENACPNLPRGITTTGTTHEAIHTGNSSDACAIASSAQAIFSVAFFAGFTR
eukprot:7754201-Karenia_brevis.AAC.1